MADAFSRREGSSTYWVGSPNALSCASGGLPEGMPLFSPSTANGLFAGTGGAGFPEVDGGAVPRLGSIEEAGFEKIIFFFFDEEGVTHSRAAGILKCGESEYRCLKVDANVRGVLPREVAQAVNGSDDTRNYGVGSGDVGKELPRVEPVDVCSLGRTCPEHLKKQVAGCIFGDTLGSTIVVRGALHSGGENNVLSIHHASRLIPSTDEGRQRLKLNTGNPLFFFSNTNYLSSRLLPVHVTFLRQCVVSR